MTQTPPFDALIAFSAALRAGNMTRAAVELGITQSAVSHRIRRLEAFMGTPLLLRHNAGLAPTPAGQSLADGLADLLSDIAGLRARCLSAAGPGSLRIGVGAGLAHNWLFRRLPDLADRHPQLSIDLEVVESEAPEQVAGLDVRIHWLPVSELRATTTQRPLFQEQVFPVCHPSLLPAGFVPGDPAVLRRLPLLHKGPAGRATSAEWSWPAWLERLGLPPHPRESLRFASIGPAIAAALEGAGVVLARTLLVHDALADGRLVRVLPEAQSLPCGRAHVVRWTSALRTDDRVKCFVAWLCQGARQTEMSHARREAALAQEP
jgi:LysR family glycine cleavage system transcriptional activator